MKLIRHMLMFARNIRFKDLIHHPKLKKETPFVHYTIYIYYTLYILYIYYQDEMTTISWKKLGEIFLVFKL